MESGQVCVCERERTSGKHQPAGPTVCVCVCMSASRPLPSWACKTPHAPRVEPRQPRSASVVLPAGFSAASLFVCASGYVNVCLRMHVPLSRLSISKRGNAHGRSLPRVHEQRSTRAGCWEPVDVPFVLASLGFSKRGLARFASACLVSSQSVDTARLGSVSGRPVQSGSVAHEMRGALLSCLKRPAAVLERSPAAPQRLRSGSVLTPGCCPKLRHLYCQLQDRGKGGGHGLGKHLLGRTGWLDLTY